MAPAEVMTGLTSATHLFSSFLSTLSQNDGEWRDSILSLCRVQFLYSSCALHSGDACAAVARIANTSISC